MKKFILKKLEWILVCWTLLIFILCATPGQYIPQISWLELLSFDKLIHAGMFFVLCLLLILFSFNHQPSFGIRIIYFFLCLSYGLSLELMQAYFFTNRTGDYMDMIANSFGAFIALLSSRKIISFFKPNIPE